MENVKLADLLQHADARSLVARMFGAHGDLGLELGSASAECVRMRLPTDARLHRLAGTASPHAGAIVTAMDSAMGLAVLLRLGDPTPLATLELRYDELREPLPGDSVEVAASCAGVHDDVAYVEASAADGQGIFARAVARFVLTRAGDSALARAFSMFLSGTYEGVMADGRRD